MKRSSNRFSSRLATVVAICVVAASPGGAVAQSNLGLLEGAAFRRAQDVVAPSVVRLERIAAAGAADGGAATGTIVRGDGLIVASGFHFPAEPTGVVAILPSGERAPAAFVARDEACNLVLLRVDVDELLPVPAAAPADEIQPGQWAIALGRTLDSPEVHGSVGVVSAVDRIWGQAVQTDAKTSPGNYGGPLIDLHGRVIGVSTALSPMGRGPRAGAEWYDSGIGFAVSFEQLLERLDRWTEGDLKPGLLGVQLGGAALFEPVEIAAVPRRGPAGEAGVRAGDIVVSLDDRPVAMLADMKFALGRRYAGDRVTLGVRRDEETLEFEITLTDEPPLQTLAGLGVLPSLGAADAVASVRYVFPNSPAARAGIEPDDVIAAVAGDETENWAAVRRELAAAAVDDEVALTLQRAGESREVAITLAEFDAGTPEALAATGPAGDAASQVLHPKLPELENEAVAYIPTGYEKESGYGLLIWFDRPAGHDPDAVVASLQEICDQRRLILLVPQPVAGGVWRRDELEVAWRMAEQVVKEYPVDVSRIAVGGVASGAGMAYAAGFENPRRVATVVAIDGLIPADVEPPRPQPLEYSAFLVGWSDASRQAAQFARDFARLQELQIPAVRMELPEAASVSDYSDTLAIWLDCMNRL